MTRQDHAVILWPGKESSDRYARDFAQALEDQGLPTEEFSLKRWRFGTANAGVFLVHWPEAAAQGSSWLGRRTAFLLWVLSVWIFRLRGGKVAWVYHNEKPHSPDRHFVASLLRLFVPAVDLLFSPSEIGLKLAQENYRGLRPESSEIARLGVYASTRDSNVGASGSGAARPTIISFGQIRPYKSLDTVIEAFDGVEADLLIVGKCLSDSYEREIRDLCASRENIVLRLGFLPEPDLDHLLANVDGVVLAMGNSLHSGALLRARSAGLPTLTPSVGALVEYGAMDSGIHLFHGPITQGRIAEFIDETGGRVALDVSELEWPEIGAQVAGSIRRSLSVEHLKEKT